VAKVCNLTAKTFNFKNFIAGQYSMATHKIDGSYFGRHIIQAKTKTNKCLLSRKQSLRTVANGI